jgi:hypothetical protein
MEHCFLNPLIMVHHYTLEERDYHLHLLYTVSHDSNAIKVRAKIRWLMTLSLVLFSVMAYGNNATGQSIYFLVLAIVAFLFLPAYTRWSYRKTYLKHVRKYYKDRMTEATSIQFEGDSLLVADTQGASTVDQAEIDAINELTEHLFIKVNSGQSIIVPLYKIEDLSLFRKEVKQFSETKGIPWNDETSWVWK